MSSAALSVKSPTSKSADAFRTISEVATELDVPQHVLRFWESRFSQIKPVKRAGGRRFYRPEDVDLLRGIRALLYSDGFTIRGVQKLLKEKGLRHVAGVGRGQATAPEPVVVEKIIYIDRPAETAARDMPAPEMPKPEMRETQAKQSHAKKRTHLRAVPTPMSLPFFDEESAPPELALQAVTPLMPVTKSGLEVEERARLYELLGELEGLKNRLKFARS